MGGASASMVKALRILPGFRAVSAWSRRQVVLILPSRPRGDREKRQRRLAFCEARMGELRAGATNSAHSPVPKRNVRRAAEQSKHYWHKVSLEPKGDYDSNSAAQRWTTACNRIFHSFGRHTLQLLGVPEVSFCFGTSGLLEKEGTRLQVTHLALTPWLLYCNFIPWTRNV